MMPAEYRSSAAMRTPCSFPVHWRLPSPALATICTRLLCDLHGLLWAKAQPQCERIQAGLGGKKSSLGHPTRCSQIEAAAQCSSPLGGGAPEASSRAWPGLTVGEQPRGCWSWSAASPPGQAKKAMTLAILRCCPSADDLSTELAWTEAPVQGPRPVRRCRHVDPEVKWQACFSSSSWPCFQTSVCQGMRTIVSSLIKNSTFACMLPGDPFSYGSTRISRVCWGAKPNIRHACSIGGCDERQGASSMP